MSRAVVQELSTSPCLSVPVNLLSLVSNVDWMHEQAMDDELMGIISCLKSGSIDAAWLKVGNGARKKKYLYVFGKILYHGSSHIVVPSHMVQQMLRLFHDSPFAGHRAFGSTLYAPLSCRYFWLRMYSLVKEYCQSCEKCQLYN